MLMGGAQSPLHLLGLEDSTRLTSPAIVGCSHMPEMLRAAERRSAVLRRQPEHRFAALRIHADDRRGQARRPDDEVANAKVQSAESRASARSRDRLYATHERERRVVSPSCGRRPVGVEHVDGAS
jgi:hypothetical protein